MTNETNTVSASELLNKLLQEREERVSSAQFSKGYDYAVVSIRCGLEELQKRLLKDNQLDASNDVGCCVKFLKEIRTHKITKAIIRYFAEK